jgi:DNA-directed RNA polymerase subunit beta'
MNKRALAELFDHSYREAGVKRTVILADRIKDIGYKFATRSGLSIAVSDMIIPSSKPDIIQEAADSIKEIERQYSEGLITDGEKYNKVVDIWAKATEDIAGEMMLEIATEKITDPDGKQVEMPSFNPIFMMADSGSRGSKDQMRQLSGMRGLMAKPSGEIIETPITANFREGLTVLQYFVSTHGAGWQIQL